MKAINAALPQAGAPKEIPDPREVPVTERQDIHIEYIESQYFPETPGLQSWFTSTVKRKYIEELTRLEEPAGESEERAMPDDAGAAPAVNPTAAPAESPAAPAAGPEDATAGMASSEGDEMAEEAAEGSGEDGLSLESVEGPQGSGWVIEIKGHHFYNADPQTWGGTHVRNTFLKNLREQKIALPMGPGQPLTEFSMEELGIQYPIIAVEWKIDQNFRIPNPYYDPEQDRRGPGYEGGGYDTGTMELGPAGMIPPAAKPAGEEETDEEERDKPVEPRYFPAPKYTFIVQFCWQEIQLTERLRRRQEHLQEEQQEDQPPAAESEPPAEGVAVTNLGG
jgi:hypothetical protein